MKEDSKKIQENIMRYIAQEKISPEQIYQDTGVNIANIKVMRSDQFLKICGYLRKDPREFSYEAFEDIGWEQKVRECARKNAALLKAIKGKVAFTMEGEAYFFRYNEELEVYETFVKLKDAEQLQMIITGITAQVFYLNSAIEESEMKREENIQELDRIYGLDKIHYEDASEAGDGSEYLEYIKLLVQRLDKTLEIYDNRSDELKEVLRALKKLA